MPYISKSRLKRIERAEAADSDTMSLLQRRLREIEMRLAVLRDVRAAILDIRAEIGDPLDP